MALEDLEAEADEQARAEGDWLTLPLGEIEVRIMPLSDWPTKALEALNDGRFDAWAELVLVQDDDDVEDGEDDVQKWLDYGPTIGEVENLMKVWEMSTGQRRGKSRASARSSKRTRRR